MTIQWYPGHMAKTLREVEENLKYVDIVLELRDARIPFSSANPKIETTIKNKPRLILLNKADMADPAVTNLWLNYFKTNKIASLAIDSVSGYNIREIAKNAKDVLKGQFAKEAEKGLKPRPFKAMILGIPNVGKSTLINTLTKKKVTETGDKPGVTKKLKWLNIKDEMLLLDTPGVLWPKFEPDVGLKLAVTGAIKTDVLPLDEVAAYALNFLKENYPERLTERFKPETMPETVQELFDLIGKMRGCLVSGNRINYDKVIDIILFEIRTEKLGRLSFERPLTK